MPLVKMGDKYLHLAEKMVYEKILGQTLPYGVTHLVYISDDFARDIQAFEAAGATHIMPPMDVSAGFGERKVAFFMTPNGWICEVAEIYRHRGSVVGQDAIRAAVQRDAPLRIPFDGGTVHH